MSEEILLKVKNLTKYFEIKKGIFGTTDYVKAVDDISFDLEKGQAISIVGESGSGKTTLGKTILRLYDPTGGSITIKGRDITKLKQKDLMWLSERSFANTAESL